MQVLLILPRFDLRVDRVDVRLEDWILAYSLINIARKLQKLLSSTVHDKHKLMHKHTFSIRLKVIFQICLTSSLCIHMLKEL